MFKGGLMTVTNYASFRGVARNTVYLWLKAGKIKQKLCCGKKMIVVKDGQTE